MKKITILFLSILTYGISYSQEYNLTEQMAARIQYIPFQFKPLLKFLRADQPRLLIADEVGVGKTIEAGLILRQNSKGNKWIVYPESLLNYYNFKAH